MGFLVSEFDGLQLCAVFGRNCGTVRIKSDQNGIDHWAVAAPCEFREEPVSDHSNRSHERSRPKRTAERRDGPVCQPAGVQRI